MAALLGAIADDFTGATELANTCVRQGMSTVQLFGAPAADLAAPEVDAVADALLDALGAAFTIARPAGPETGRTTCHGYHFVGETSGAVVQGLGTAGIQIGPQIDPGVPWTASLGPEPLALALALKSGNFGGPEFFTKAFEVLP